MGSEEFMRAQTLADSARRSMRPISPKKCGRPSRALCLEAPPSSSQHPMKKAAALIIPTTLLTLAFAAAFIPATPSATAAEGEKTKDDEIISSVMKLCNKAPKGAPKLAEKVADSSASDEETKQLIESYKTLKGTKPPKGEADAWDKKITTLLAAVDALEKKEAGAGAKFKEANA